MVRKLKTYVTKSGFFEHAIAAPSMKAALEAWGAKTNLFQKGFAKQTSDPKITAAAMARPGVVLRRAIGSNGKFKENAKLPAELVEAKSGTDERRWEPQRPPTGATGEEADSKAAVAFEREQMRRRSARRREERAQEKMCQRRATICANKCPSDVYRGGAHRIEQVRVRTGL